MREILFKAKIEWDNVWVEGYYSDKNVIMLKDNNKTHRTIIPETISEYTGVKDQHNVKVFENDLIKVAGRICKVFWDEQQYGWSCRDIKITDTESLWYCASLSWVSYMPLEIVGNVYD